MSNFQNDLQEIENTTPLALFSQFEKLNKVMFIDKENIFNNNEDRPIRRDLYGEFYKAKMNTEAAPQNSRKRSKKSFVINTFASKNHKRSLSKETNFSSRVLKKKINPLRASIGNFMRRNKSKKPTATRLNRKKKTYLSTNYVNTSSNLIFEHLVKRNPRLLR